MSEQTQKDFEEWAESKKWCTLKTDGVYNNTIVGCAFEAWQASRAAIFVELPGSYEYPDGVKYLDEDAVMFSLEQSGVSYK